jgi:hypothetical protein
MLTLTDDLTNSISMGAVDAYSAIVRAVNPDFQTKDLATLKGADIDIDLLLLSKDYG